MGNFSPFLIVLFSAFIVVTEASWRCTFPGYRKDKSECSVRNGADSCCGGYSCIGKECKPVSMVGENDVDSSNQYAVVARILSQQALGATSRVNNQIAQVSEKVIETEKLLDKLTKKELLNVDHRNEIENKKIQALVNAAAEETIKLINNPTTVTNNMEEWHQYYNQYDVSYQYTPGYEGSPCGKTIYKDFGKCIGHELVCVKAHSRYKYAPGSCQANVQRGGSGRGLQMQNETETSAGGQQSLPGQDGGPCGKTAYMDFGPCSAGLMCESGPMIWIPGTCKNNTDTDTVVAEKDDTKPKTMPNDTDSSDNDKEPKIGVADKKKKQGPDMKVEAQKIADATNELALATADAAEAIGRLLLASAANLRKSADRLSQKSAGEAPTVQPASSTLTVANIADDDKDSIPVVKTDSSKLAYVFIVGSCVCLVLVIIYVYNRSTVSDYETII